MPAPGNPCAPALLAVPNGTSGLPLPLLDAGDYIPDPTPGPSYQDITCALISCDENAPDGLDDIVALAGSLADEWDTASSAQDADMDTILATLNATDTGAADQAQSDFVNSFAAGDTLVQGVAGISLPDYGSLPTAWVQPGAVAVTPPGLTPDTPIHAGDPQFTWRALLQLPAVEGQHNYAPTAKLAFGNTGIILSATQAYYFDSGHLPAFLGDYVDVVVNPTKAGTFQDAIVVTGPGIVGAPTFSIYVTVLP